MMYIREVSGCPKFPVAKPYLSIAMTIIIIERNVAHSQNGVSQPQMQS